MAKSIDMALAMAMAMATVVLAEIPLDLAYRLCIVAIANHCDKLNSCYFVCAEIKFMYKHVGC